MSHLQERWADLLKAVGPCPCFVWVCHDLNYMSVPLRMRKDSVSLIVGNKRVYAFKTPEICHDFVNLYEDRGAEVLNEDPISGS